MTSQNAHEAKLPFARGLRMASIAFAAARLGPSAAAQAALDQALLRWPWQQVLSHQFKMPVHFEDVDSFERQLMWPSIADHQIDAALAARVRAAFDAAGRPPPTSRVFPLCR